MTTLFLRTLVRLFVGFVSMIIYMRILGGMQLSPQSPVDQIGNFVLGGIIGGIIYNLDIPLWQFFMVIVTWGTLSLIAYFIRERSLKAKRILDGKPVLIMEDGILLTKEIEKQLITADDLMSRLHQLGVSCLGELQTIWLETNGQLTIVHKDDSSFAYVLIEDGQVNDIDMRRASVDKQWLLNELKKCNVDKIEDVFIAEYKNEELCLHLKGV